MRFACRPSRPETRRLRGVHQQNKRGDDGRRRRHGFDKVSLVFEI